MKSSEEFRFAIGAAIERLNDMSDSEIANARAALMFWLAQCDAVNAVNRMRGTSKTKDDAL